MCVIHRGDGAIRRPCGTTPRVAQCTNFRSPTSPPRDYSGEEREREKKRALSAEEFTMIRDIVPNPRFIAGHSAMTESRKFPREINSDHDSAIGKTSEGSSRSRRIGRRGRCTPTVNVNRKMEAAPRKENAYARQNSFLPRLEFACLRAATHLRVLSRRLARVRAIFFGEKNAIPLRLLRTSGTSKYKANTTRDTRYPFPRTLRWQWTLSQVAALSCARPPSPPGN